MASSKSVRKRIRQDARKRLHNRTARSALRTAVKKLRAAVASGDAAAAGLYAAVQKRADTMAGKGILHRRTAARMKSRLAAALAKAQAAKPA